MSHHLDTEAARLDPRLNISDVYLFKGTHGTVFVINVDPLSGTGGFHPEALYEFKIDTNDDAVEDVTLRVAFRPKDADGTQEFVLTQLRGADARNRDAIGQVVASGRTEREIHGHAGTRVWIGRAGEPFYIEGNVVTAVRTALTTGSRLDLAAFDLAKASNLFGNSNVTSIVLEVPPSVTGMGTIGFWGTSALPDHHGGWVQINRTATPLINTLFDFSADGTVDFNAGPPSEGQARFGQRAQDDVMAAVIANGTHTPGQAAAYGAYVRQLLFPDVLRYRVGTPAHFGHWTRNGRGLTEPTPETMFQLVLGQPIRMGLTEKDAAGSLRPHFPYLSLPV